MPKITAPVKGFTGEVVGVTFKDGKGKTEDALALAYFARQGYEIEGEAVKPKPASDAKADPKTGDETKPEPEAKPEPKGKPSVKPVKSE